MPLPSMTVTGDFNEILGSVVDDELVETALSRARVQFRSNISPGAFVTWGDSLYRVGYVNAIVNSDGDLVLDDGEGTPVKLLAQHGGLNIRGLQWQVRIELMPASIPPSPAGKMRAFWFDAVGDDETVDLATVATVPRVAPIYVIPGPSEDSTDLYPALDLYPSGDLYPGDNVFYPKLDLYPALELFPA